MSLRRWSPQPPPTALVRISNVTCKRSNCPEFSRCPCHRPLDDFKHMAPPPTVVHTASGMQVTASGCYVTRSHRCIIAARGVDCGGIWEAGQRSSSIWPTLSTFKQGFSDQTLSLFLFYYLKMVLKQFEQLLGASQSLGPGVPEALQTKCKTCFGCIWS